MYKISDLPIEERPRERLKKNGVTSLSDCELLAILLRTGSKDNSAIEIAKDLIIKENNLGQFNSITLEELKSNKGIKEAKAITILAAIEFGKRVFGYHRTKRVIDSVEKSYELVRYEMENLTFEEVRVAYLNTKLEVIELKVMGNGGTYNATFDPKEIVKWGLKLSCYGYILYHNHPSGDAACSEGDVISTMNLIKYSKQVDVIMIDHLIVGKNSYYSFREHNFKYLK